MTGPGKPLSDMSAAAEHDPLLVPRRHVDEARIDQRLASRSRSRRTERRHDLHPDLRSVDTPARPGNAGGSRDAKPSPCMTRNSVENEHSGTPLPAGLNSLTQSHEAIDV
jgi:hypothetical protein